MYVSKCVTVTEIKPEMDVYALTGDSLALVCQLSPDSPANCSTPFFKRIHDNSDSADRLVSQHNRTAIQLEIEQVSTDDEGEYFCYTGLEDKDPNATDGRSVYVASQFRSIMIIIVVVIIIANYIDVSCSAMRMGG